MAQLYTKPYEFWFAAGSQHLYGPGPLQQVESNSRDIVEALNRSGALPFPVSFKRLLTTPEEIARLSDEANVSGNCAGILTWMHTFSPAKMWIAGLTGLRKPLLHLHTQYNRDIPWDSIDMDFMNLNQAAHGDREYGFIGARLGIARKVVVGHWSDPQVQRRIGEWMSQAAASVESRGLKVARFGDNMRQVAVTEGDKVEAQIKFGWSIDGYGIGDLVARMREVTDAEVSALFDEYGELYELPAESLRPGAVRESILEQARIELALGRFLKEGGFGAFTTTFEDLHGMKQLPGLAVQRLMAHGYGFGGEGDWKTAALTRTMKLMAGNAGTSFMEDYTYHLEPGNELILGAHMLEICPTIAADRPRIAVHPLGIGGKEDPARLIFNGREGAAVNASLVDLGGRFRLIVNEVEAVKAPHGMPKLPVARVLWKPLPSLAQSAEAWIYAGGAHHTVFSYAVTTEQLVQWAEQNGIECVVIDRDTDIRQFRNELRWNEMYWKFKS
ncbi:L-arabinose isomerase [Paenibacillus thermoaerophilus]|uniref:L-arabinose isomerase n=1 Tax=Paenibacillus thermoaerophilus TaxID=1215385 RepID=A0ABW2UYQ2_9BACL|nr:L-arabinose isomerase [Paenibacillus thermoaerophilus]TMV16070.1 L-arabinose isomerase [Paenibacillus thermoaerophilus]